MPLDRLEATRLTLASLLTLALVLLELGGHGGDVPRAFVAVAVALAWVVVVRTPPTCGVRSYLGLMTSRGDTGTF